jgi:ACR3 family arsenite transporter
MTQNSVPTPKRLPVFERYLSMWVGLCMLVGIGVGKAAAVLTDGLRRLEFGHGSQINVPIAVLIWLMITPMMMKVDFAAVARSAGDHAGS